MKKYLKYILSFLLVALIFYLTVNTILTNYSLDAIIKNLAKVNILWIFICILLMILYFLCQGIYMKRAIKLLDRKTTLLKTTFYALVEFFFSGITPVSTGGQPMQLYYMKKDHLPLSKSLIVILINTICFKSTLVVLGIIILLIDYKIVFNMNTSFIIFYFIGMLFDFIVAFFAYLIIYKQKILVKILKIFDLVKNKLKIKPSILLLDKIDTYKKELKYVKSNKKEMLIIFTMTFIQRLLLFSISYVVYRAFGYNKLSYFEVVLFQVAVQVAVEFIPLPGGTGISEYFMNIFYITIYGNILATTSMILTRTFSFYIPLMACGLVISIKYIVTLYLKKIRKKRH